MVIQKQAEAKEEVVVVPVETMPPLRNITIVVKSGILHEPAGHSVGEPKDRVRIEAIVLLEGIIKEKDFLESTIRVFVILLVLANLVHECCQMGKK